jgi:hypothetical protein
MGAGTMKSGQQREEVGKVIPAESNELGEYEEQASSASEVWRLKQFLVAATRGQGCGC